MARFVRTLLLRPYRYIFFFLFFFSRVVVTSLFSLSRFLRAFYRAVYSVLDNLVSIVVARSLRISRNLKHVVHGFRDFRSFVGIEICCNCN